MAVFTVNLFGNMAQVWVKALSIPKKKVANGLPKRSTWTGESVHCLDVQFAKHMEVSSKWGYTKIENDGFIMENPSING